MTAAIGVSAVNTSCPVRSRDPIGAGPARATRLAGYCGPKSKKSVEWFWKEWGWMPLEVVKYVKNKELVMLTGMTGTHKVTVRYEILRAKGKTIFRVHESGYPTKDLKSAFMMCEGWTEFHCYLKAHLMGVDLRKAG
jgi:hypothetical protein